MAKAAAREGYHLGAGMFRRSGTGADSAKSHESGVRSTKTARTAGDGYSLGDQSGRRRGAGQSGEGSNRSERDQ